MKTQKKKFMEKFRICQYFPWTNMHYHNQWSALILCIYHVKKLSKTIKRNELVLAIGITIQLSYDQRHDLFLTLDGIRVRVLGSRSKAPCKKPPDKSHQTISLPVNKPPRIKVPRNKIPPIEKVPQNKMPPIQKASQNKMPPIQKAPRNNWPLLQIDGVSVTAATTYRRTHKHSQDVTRHIKLNPRATRGFYVIHT